MATRARWILLAALCLVPGVGSGDEAAPVVTITLKDGGTLVGAIVREDGSSLTLRTASGVELVLPREAIAARESRVPAPPPASLPGDPNESRLMFAPTGRPLGKGNGYFSDHYVLFPGFAYGLTKNVAVAGGISVIPALGLSDQVFYLSASSAWRLGTRASLALGGLYASAPGPDEDIGAAAALFGVATLGPSDRSLSVGLGWLATREEEYRYDDSGAFLGSHGHWRFRDAPVLMLGGSLRVARNLSLVSESWLFLGKDFDLSQQPFGFSLRFFSGRISADVGVVLVAEVLDEGFPVPWLSFSYHFGPARRAAGRSGPATPAWARAAARGAR